jgi:hypothetical protein
MQLPQRNFGQWSANLRQRKMTAVAVLRTPVLQLAHC